MQRTHQSHKTAVVGAKCNTRAVSWLGKHVAERNGAAYTGDGDKPMPASFRDMLTTPQERTLITDKDTATAKRAGRQPEKSKTESEGRRHTGAAALTVTLGRVQGFLSSASNQPHYDRKRDEQL